ncbi:class I SAM-dependent methyltransferase [Gimesia alba]|uniref:class I SAM-dependent methyltransferase n=1 Tax=Gimesia alba TaxID=2527973 RepID=UPI0018D9AA11|nr:class I SAM-dependent methyltransferase [Gimesia alba]
MSKAFTDSNVYFVDIGCGPGTSGLAFAELFKETPFRYVGIDLSNSMRKKGKTLLNALNEKTSHQNILKIYLTKSIEKLPENFPKKAAIIFNFSFFFGSKFLNNDLLKTYAEKILKIVKGKNQPRVFISYTNSQYLTHSKRYFEFLKLLGFEQSNEEFISDLQKVTISYYTRRKLLATKKDETFYRELFEMT